MTQITVDMKLYKLAMQIMWSYPKSWSNLTMRPGAMHTLSSFLGTIGTIMKGSGLEEYIRATYKGIPNMLNGKNWPRAVRRFRMVSFGLVFRAMIDDLHLYDTDC